MSFTINNQKIGALNPIYFVAELSANHNQNFSLAKKTIRAMAEAGADAVKLQTYTPDTITLNVKNSYFRTQKGSLWQGGYLYDLYKKAYTPWEWQPKLKKYAESLRLALFSSPFDKSAVDFLEKMRVPAYKIASPEITDIGLIEYVAKKKKPIIISTGVATKEDIRLAVGACRKVGNNQLVLLKCVSEYPTDYKEMNLNLIPQLKKDFKVVVGLSDHSMGLSAPIASVALGAKIIEKHFILNRKLGGPDASFSMEPSEFKQMVREVRNTEKALGKATYTLSKKIRASRKFCRSLFVVQDIQKGEKFSEKNIRSIRPGYGLHPKYLDKILGKKAKTNFKKGVPLKINHF